jgi:hypothetical protein
MIHQPEVFFFIGAIVGVFIVLMVATASRRG